MKKDYLIIGGTEFRVEINMDTVEMWEGLSGKKLGEFEIEAALSVNNGGVSTHAMFLWLYCAIVQGAELDGKSFELDLLEFKRMCRPYTMTEFAPIFIKQYIGESSGKKLEKEQLEEKKKRTIRYRLLSFVKSPWVRLGGIVLILIFAVRYFFGMH